MSNPFSGPDNPAMSSMADPLGFIKKLWGGMSVPGMVAPPMSVDELDKKIQDLKTVESWLNVNMNMLRGTIQALEVQRATFAALQSLGETFSQHAQQAGQATQAATTAEATNHHADWPMPSAAKAAADEPAAAAAGDAAEPQAEAQKEGGANASAGAAFANPAAWWNLLQDQFKQAVSKAMEGEPAATAGAKTASRSDANIAAATKPNAKPKTGPAAAKKTSAVKAAKPAAAKPASKAAAKTSSGTNAKNSRPLPQKKI